MRPVPFSYERWCDVALQAEQLHEPPTANMAAHLALHGKVWAYESADGITIAVGGLYPIGPGQAAAWTYLGADSGEHMVALVRAMRRIMAEHANQWPIIRATVLDDFAAGQRLMALLGFKPLLASEPILFRARVYRVMQRVSYGGN
jgi:hypothetical protein